MFFDDCKSAPFSLDTELELNVFKVFDEGHLRASPNLAQEEADATIAILSDSHPPVDKNEHPLRYITQSLWQRFRQVKFPGESSLECHADEMV